MAVVSRRERRAREGRERPARHAVYVWELPVRVVHWTIVITLIVLSFTGIYIYDPFPIGANQGQAMGDPGFTLAWMRYVHDIAGFVFTAAVLARVYWAFAGNRYAHWRALLPLTRSQRRDLRDMVNFYTLRRLHPPRANGHNPLAALAYLAVYGLFGLSIISGLGLFAWVTRIPIWKSLFGWTWTVLPIEQLRLVHFLLMFVFGAFTAFHVYCSILVDIDERNGELSSIITGYKANVLDGESPRDAPPADLE
jgi:Ni/Fe-hydrogenase 1 B-type cytochrome subunit